MIHVEPWQNALRVEMMFAAQEEDFISSTIRFYTNGAHVVLSAVLLDYLLRVQLANKGIFHAMIALHLIKHLLVIDLLKRLAVNAVQGRLERVRISIQHTLILVIPIDPV